MNERIRELRKTLNLTLKKFGDKIGVSEGAVSNIEKGNRNVTEQMFKSICREFNVNEEWLRNGTGEMFKTSVVLPVVINDCNIKERIIGAISAMSDDKIAIVWDYIQKIMQRR